MEIINSVILVGIVISALINLVIEMDESKGRSRPYLIGVKVIFTTMAIGAILAVYNPKVVNFIVLNASVLTALVLRIYSGKHKI